jgi:LAS superfamily LD-carboxypeptidase LdcB
MHRVYEIAQARGARRRPYVAAADEVEVIERGPCPGAPADVEPDCRRTQWAQRDAARAARRLLAAARKTFDADRDQHGQRNLLVYTGYRSAAFQLEIWEYHFPGRYRATKRARARARGGPHGDAAALLLAQYFGVRTAPPGYSLHNRGLAIDFGCITRDGHWIGSNGTFVKAWKKSYCFKWMEANAARFGFRPNENIDEPWHWEYVGGPQSP